MIHDKGKPTSAFKALTLSEAVQLLKANADAALLQAIAATSDKSKSTILEKCPKWGQEG